MRGLRRRDSSEEWQAIMSGIPNTKLGQRLSGPQCRVVDRGGAEVPNELMRNCLHREIIDWMLEKLRDGSLGNCVTKPWDQAFLVFFLLWVLGLSFLPIFIVAVRNFSLWKEVRKVSQLRSAQSWGNSRPEIVTFHKIVIDLEDFFWELGIWKLFLKKMLASRTAFAIFLLLKGL